MGTRMCAHWLSVLDNCAIWIAWRSAARWMLRAIAVAALQNDSRTRMRLGKNARTRRERSVKGRVLRTVCLTRLDPDAGLEFAAEDDDVVVDPTTTACIVSWAVSLEFVFIVVVGIKGEKRERERERRHTDC